MFTDSLDPWAYERREAVKHAEQINAIAASDACQLEAIAAAVERERRYRMRLLGPEGFAEFARAWNAVCNYTMEI